VSQFGGTRTPLRAEERSDACRAQRSARPICGSGEGIRRSKQLVTRWDNRPAFLLGASFGLLALLLHSVVDFNLHIPANAILAVCLCALVAGQVGEVHNNCWIRCDGSLRLIVTVLLLVVLGYLGQQGWRRWRECGPLEEARLAEERSKGVRTSLSQYDRNSPQHGALRQRIAELDAQAVAALKQAHQIDPMNFMTTYRIGETLRLLSWEGQVGYQQLAIEAMEWFGKGMQLNPWDGLNYLGYGQCLHWVRRYDKTQPYFNQALALDPNGYYTAAQIGWHFVNLGRYAEAQPWLERSLRLYPHRKADDNPFAVYYLDIVKKRLADDGAKK
jgi:hypothetical protein